MREIVNETNTFKGYMYVLYLYERNGCKESLHRENTVHLINLCKNYVIFKHCMRIDQKFNVKVY